MAAVTITLPVLLSNLIGEKTIAVEAATPSEALQELVRRYPALDMLLFDETGELREHVLCFHNEENTRWCTDGLYRALAANDRMTIIQAVAGG